MNTRESQEALVLAAYVCMLREGLARAARMELARGAPRRDASPEVAFLIRTAAALLTVPRSARRRILVRFGARHEAHTSSRIVAAIRSDRRRLPERSPEHAEATRLYQLALERRRFFRRLEDAQRNSQDYKDGMALFAGTVRRLRVVPPRRWA